MINSMEKIIQQARQQETQNVVVAGAAGEEVLKSVKKAQTENIIRPILVGEEGQIKNISSGHNLALEKEQIVPASSTKEICQKSVSMLADGRADVLMKGLVDTSKLMKEVLKKEYNLRTERHISHLVLAEVPAVDRLLFISDGGMNIKPSLQEKVCIVQNAIDAAHKLGWREPRVAVLAAVEKTKEAMPETLDAAVLSKMADRGQISGGIVEGPFALDNALSEEAAEIKGLTGPVAGKADILITPEIASGNLLGKSVIHLAGGRFAALLGGTRKPIVVTSRADTAEVRFISLAASVVMALTN